MSFLAEFAQQVYWIVKETAPFMLLGILFAGALRYLISEKRFVSYFGGNDLKSVGLAALFGVPIPLCSCSVLPMMISLRQRGASKGATTSFLISAPETGVDSIGITYALLDPIFTIARPVAALISAVVTGSVVNLFVRRGWDRNGAPSAPGPLPEAACCNATPADSGEKPSAASCCCADKVQGKKGEEEGSFFRKSIRYSFGPLIDSLTPLLILAFTCSALIGVFIPDRFLENTIVHGWSGMVIMLLIGIPVYVCATSSTPLVAALLLKGLSPGAALVFLLSGPVTNLGTIIAVMHQMGKRVMVIYVVCTAILTLLAGGIIDSIYSDLGIPVTAIVGKSSEMIPEPLKVTAVAALFALMVASARRTRLLNRWLERMRTWCRPLGFDPAGNRAGALVILALIFLYLSTAFTVVDVGEKGWLFSFGKAERDQSGEVISYEPGLCIHQPYPFQTVLTGHPDEVRSLTFGYRPLGVPEEDLPENSAEETG
ncbi:MAG: SO_0444 family Cu/Zn efflux transporter, partial [Planctomycetota bacterium]